MRLQKKNTRPGEPKRAAVTSNETMAGKTPAARTFEHRFATGNRATVTIGPDDPCGQRCAWDRLPIALSDVAEYIEWQKMIRCEIAMECGAGVVFALKSLHGWVTVICSPGQSAADVEAVEMGGAR